MTDRIRARKADQFLKIADLREFSALRPAVRDLPIIWAGARWGFGRTGGGRRYPNLGNRSAAGRPLYKMFIAADAASNKNKRGAGATWRGCNGKSVLGGLVRRTPPD